MTRLLVCALITLISAANLQADLPDGTWKWSSTMGDRNINSTLHLTSEENLVRGRYRDENIDEGIEEGKLDGNQLRFQLALAMNGQEIVVKFQGTVADSELKGSVQFIVDGEQRGDDFPWTATRYVGQDEVVGTWNFRYTAPDGVAYQPELIVTQNGDGLTGSMSFDGNTLDIESIELQKNAFSFDLTLPYQGSDLDLTYKCYPRGNRLTGSLEYELDGNTGEFDIAGTRKHLSSEEQELLGEWEFRLVGNDGVERTPVLKLSDNAGDLAATLTDAGESFDLQDVEFRDGKLTFNFTRNHDGLTVNINWACEPTDDGMSGQLEYDADGNTGEIALSGKRRS